MRKVWRLCLLSFFLFLQVTWALDRQSNSDYRMRRQALASKASSGVVLLFASNEAEGPNDLYGYRPDDNFFYLSGWAEPGAAVLVQAGTTDHPYTEILFLPNHSPSQEKWTGPKLGADNPDAGKITGVDHVEVLDNLRSELVRLLPAKRVTVYTDVVSDDETSNSVAPLDWLKRANAFPVGVSFERIRHATDASIAAHLAAMHTVKPGTTEREISALMQYEWGKRGCERPAYSPIVGSGFNSTVLHYSSDSGTMQAGDVVVIDAAGEYSMYASDITRTLPASGKFTARQQIGR